MPGQGFIGSVTKESGDENLVSMILDGNGTKVKLVYLAFVWALQTDKKIRGQSLMTLLCKCEGLSKNMQNSNC